MVVGRRGQRFVERRDRPRPGFGQRRAMLGHLRFERRQPAGIGGVGLGKQFVARAHRRLVARRMMGMAGLERQHQPVEEAAAVAGAGR